jgi:acyl-ACP thioesterase
MVGSALKPNNYKGNMGLQTTWQEDYVVKSSDTDFQAKLRLSNLFTWMQDVAANHANHLGVGYHELLKQDMAWVLSRKKVRFFDFPRMDEKVAIQTWPKGIQQKLFFMRDHQINGEDGRLLALSTTAYVLVNIRARRVLPANVLDISIPSNEGKYAIDEALEKIPPVGNGGVDGLNDCFTIQAGYSMVDLMGHVNNVRYIDWICDCFPISEYQERKPGWLQINYNNEVKPGEGVCLQRAPYPTEPGSWYIAGTNQTSGAKAFEAKFHWE